MMVAKSISDLVVFRWVKVQMMTDCACVFLRGRARGGWRAREHGTAHYYCHSTAGAGIMEADDRQVTTVFTVQPSFHHRHSTNEYHEALPSSANDEVRCDCTFADDGNAS